MQYGFLLSSICGLFMSLFMMGANSCEKQSSKEVEDNPAKQVQVESSCAIDDDCALVKADCCGCRQGGKQIALDKRQVNAKEAELEQTCKDMMCAQVISSDKSCSQNAKCVQGSCVLQ